MHNLLLPVLRLMQISFHSLKLFAFTLQQECQLDGGKRMNEALINKIIRRTLLARAEYSQVMIGSINIHFYVIRVRQ